MSAQQDYWTECLECSFDEAGIVATPEQIESVSRDVEVSHENYGMAFYQPSGPSQIEIDLKETRRLLAAERDKIICRDCNGRGRIITQGPYHSSNMHCDKCNGDGRHAP